MASRTRRRLHQLSVVELMEGRVLLSGTSPTITGATVGDGSAQNNVMILTASEALNASTVNSKSVLVYTAGPDKVLGTKDDVLDKSAGVTYNSNSNTITISTGLAANTPFAVDVLGNVVTDTTGDFLAGDGTDPASDYQIESSASAAVFHISADGKSIGTVTEDFLPQDAPQSVANFLYYVEKGSYNNTFFHRTQSVSADGIGIIQAGGYLVTSGDRIAPITVRPNFTLPLEYNVPNALGTLAMARGSADDSGTDEWFFNTADNSTALGPNGSSDGYAVFAQVDPNDTESMNVLTTLAGLPSEDISSLVDPNDGSNSPFTTVPLANFNSARPTFNPKVNLVEVTSISLVLGDTSSVSLSTPTATITSKAPSIIYTGSSGNTATISITLQNPGFQLTGPATVTLFASSDQALDGSHTQITTISQNVTILPGKSFTFNIPLSSVSVPNTITNSNFLVAQISGLTAAPILAASATEVPFAAPNIDLTDKITQVPSLVTNDQMVLSFSVTNNGNITAKGSLQILFGGSIDGLTGDEVDFATIPENINLAPGATVSFSKVKVAIPPSVATDNYFIIGTLANVGNSPFNENSPTDNTFINTPYTVAIIQSA